MHYILMYKKKTQTNKQKDNNFQVVYSSSGERAVGYEQSKLHYDM